jgi:hypothetical protein
MPGLPDVHDKLTDSLTTDASISRSFSSLTLQRLLRSLAKLSKKGFHIGPLVFTNRVPGNTRVGFDSLIIFGRGNLEETLSLAGGHKQSPFGHIYESDFDFRRWIR